MTIDVISFTDNPKAVNERSLRDLPDRVVDGDPQHVSKIYFESDDGVVTTGTWKSTPGKWHAFTGKDEFCYIVEGHCRLISEDGNSKDYKKGDAFFIPDGFKGYWEVVETTIKHYVVRKTD